MERDSKIIFNPTFSPCICLFLRTSRLRASGHGSCLQLRGTEKSLIPRGLIDELPSQNLKLKLQIPCYPFDDPNQLELVHAELASLDSESGTTNYRGDRFYPDELRYVSILPLYSPTRGTS
jgi:hypothetical protein